MSLPFISSTSKQDETKIQDLIQRIQIEKKLVEGAQQMLKKLTDSDAKQLCHLNLIQSQQKVEFLETELKKLTIKFDKTTPDSASTPFPSSAVSNTSTGKESILNNEKFVDTTEQSVCNEKKPSNSTVFGNLLSSFGKKDKLNKNFGSNSSLNSASTRNSVNTTNNAVLDQNLSALEESKPENFTKLDYLKVDTPLRTEKVNFRLYHIKGKLDLEQKVKAGTSNLVEAMKKNPNSDQKLSNELQFGLEQKIMEASAKIGFLIKSVQQYSGLVVFRDEDEDDVIPFRSARRSGRLKVKLLGAIGYGKRSSKDDFFCVIKIDSIVKATSKPSSKQKFEETFDIEVSKAQEVEISLYEKVSGGHQRSPLLSFVWFSISDLEEDLAQKYDQNYSGKKIDEFKEMWLDMEPGGQVLCKMNFASVCRTTTNSNQVFRRRAVQKLYPRNGHKFAATQIYGVSQCAVCNEFMTSQNYSCQNCQYACHPHCYNKVSTKCISELEYSILKAEGGDTNTGELLKYNIPHKFQQTINLSPNWCGHCGYILPIGKKVSRCTECQKNSHKNCSNLIPNFCGLNPNMANALIAAWDDADKKQSQRELEEAELEASKVREMVQKENNLIIKTLPENKELFTGSHQNEQESNQLNSSKKPLSVTPPLRIDSRNWNEVSQNQISSLQYPRTSKFPDIPSASSYTDNGGTETAFQQNLVQGPQFSQNQQLHSQSQNKTQEQYSQQNTNFSIEVRECDEKVQQNAVLKDYSVSPVHHVSQMQQQPEQVHTEFQAAREKMLAQYQQQRLAARREENNGLEYQRKLAQQKLLEHQKSILVNNAKPKRRQHVVERVTLNDFHFVSVLGRGAFGKVMLATEKQTKKLYAIKALKKEFIIQSDDVKSTKLEKRIFQVASAAHHPFLINLHSSFQTESRIYFVMEYISGGDLMCHIQDKKRFPSARTKFYACEVLLALEYFHKNNIIYRDLKLDNILMTPEGHIKVADYGICKDNIGYGVTTRTFCGTPDYMAPEILLSNRYGRAVDWWSFGVLIYVMLVGKYPFHGEDELQILDAILEDSIVYPPNLPRETFAILNQLLNRNPARRLGGGKMDAEEVKKHPYFNGVDWNAILSKQIPPPWKPTIKSPTDVSNFDSEFTKEKAVLTPINSVLSQVNQDEFKDFEYISEWAAAERLKAKSMFHLE
ncbi:Serine/threonine kinase [Lobulomyces angularis]|nr:Serine/threonine kinase [Lobulomyces angularis]